jgi:HSP20 family molecular chaperone IbpA
MNRDNERAEEFALNECLVDVRFDDNEFIVIADIPGASRGDLLIGVNPKTNTLVLGKNETVLERIPLPWKSAEAARVRLNNGVLEVRMRSADS